MNLRMDMEVLDFQERGMASDFRSEGRRAGEFARPKQICQSPLQRLGQAFRISQAALSVPSIAAPVVPRSETEPLLGSNHSWRKTPKQFYKLYPSDISLAASLETNEHAALDSGNASSGSDTSIIDPAIKAEQKSRKKSYFAGTGLLSSLFSNPRTRAPFKPQKANRGTSSWQLKQYAEATLGSGSLRKAVRLPEGEDKDEWLAVNGGWSYST